MRRRKNCGTFLLFSLSWCICMKTKLVQNILSVEWLKARPKTFSISFFDLFQKWLHDQYFTLVVKPFLSLLVFASNLNRILQHTVIDIRIIWFSLNFPTNFTRSTSCNFLPQSLSSFHLVGIRLRRGDVIITECEI